jgi:hypothetical protein
MNVMLKRLYTAPGGMANPYYTNEYVCTAGQLIPVKGYLLTFVQVRLGGEIYD